MKQANLLLIDDDEELCELLSEYLSNQGFNITLAHDGQSGLDKANATRFDLILLDVMLPGLDGFEVLKQLHQNNKTPVLMLTVRGDDFDRIFGLELSADNYLPKPFNHRELVARIKAITRRMEHIQSLGQEQPLAINRVKFNLASRQVFCDDHEVSLTGTEFQMRHSLMTRPGGIISKQTLSQSVLGRQLTPFDRSIDMHLSNIRKKLQAHSDDEKRKTVRDAGYIFIKEAAQ
jgi:two-component system response regulator CpxR